MRNGILPLLLLAAIPASPQQNMYRFAVDQDSLSGAPDFSSLNHPIGAADRVFVRDGHFFTVGADLKPNTADDRRVRFFGVNLAFGANFPEQADAQRIARRLRRLGVNLVRLHHMDSNPDRNPESANSTLTTGPYPSLNPVSIARLRHFLDALKAEGIYANLNVHVGYRFRPEVDGVPPLPGQEMPTQSKPLHIFYPRMVELQEQYARQLIEALKLKDDPVLAMAELDNETSMLQAWGNGSLDRAAVGEYRAELEKQWKAFLKTDAELVAVKDTSNPHIDDYLLFLADRDRAYLHRMRRAVREAAGVLVPVTGTQMSYGGLLNLDAQAEMDYQDNHFYIDHYNFPHQPWDQHDWRIRDTSAVGSGLAAFLNMAVSRVAGQPYTVSEFNEPWPNRHAAEIDPLLAVFAAFQDWDGIIHFAYAHGRDWDTGVPASFNINGDWTKFPNIGQAAWIFRTGAVQAAGTVQGIAIDGAKELAAAKQRGGNVAAYLRTIGIPPENALQQRVELGKDRARSWQGAPGAPEFTYDAAARRVLIAAPQAAGAFGFFGREPVTAGSLGIQLPSDGFACILATSLDGKALSESSHILISTPGYTLGTIPGADPAAMQKFIPYPGATDWWTLVPEPQFASRPSGRMDGGKAPAWMERVESIITLYTAVKNLAVYPLDGAGRRLAPIAAEPLTGGFRIHLNAESQPPAPWYEIAQR